MSWTEERRKKQAEAIRKHKPWLKSTGPKSYAGKQCSSLNALKHGGYAASLETLRDICRRNREFLQLYKLFSLQNTLEQRRKNELIKNRLISKGNPHPPPEKGERTDEHGN